MTATELASPYPRQALVGPLPERHPLISADATTDRSCLDCGGRGFDTDDDGSMTGVAGAWMVCGCFPDHEAHWPPLPVRPVRRAFEDWWA